MASLALLEAELKKLGSQAKRHSVQLAEASESSLKILETVRGKESDEQVAIAHLKDHEEFVSPFLLACCESSAKSCASALQCIQTLATYQGIAPARLKELLQALMEATQLGLGIQLKILQLLPVLLGEFAQDLSSELLVDLLAVCTELLSQNKVAMVHNTAYATLQQLINGVFDRTNLPSSDVLQTVNLCDAANTTFEVKPHLHDTAMVLVDLCNLAENEPTKFIRLDKLSVTFTLELLELTLSNQDKLIHSYNELAAILRVRIVPLLLTLFAESPEFPIQLRVTRVFYLLLRQHLAILPTESEVVLASITHAATIPKPQWKQSLALEVLNGLFLEVELLADIYTRFDGEQRRTSAVQTILADFSTILATSPHLLLINSIKPDDDNARYLSRESALNPPIIEMLDRVEPPNVDEFYPLYQLFKCVNTFSDAVHKLATTDFEAKQLITETATPLLKCYSVGLAVMMELDCYRLVVRAVQRLAHASGIVGQREARDDFLQLLAQHCQIEDDNEIVLPRVSLCVRALFNLGYALGNQLGDSWTFITHTITKLNSSVLKIHDSDINCIFGNDEGEYQTLNLAGRKLMESTTKLSDSALVAFINSMGNERDSVKFTVLKFVAIFNAARLAESDTSTWEAFATIILSGISQQSDANRAFNALTEVSEFIVSDSARLKSGLPLIIGTTCKAISSPNMELQTLAFRYLNSVLERFGQYISTGWEDVFVIVSSIPREHNLELIRCAFITLELICSDFLENLPFSCVFSLTLCLDEFSKQTVDLNTSFTSVSLFWSVCDHLMAREKTNTGDFPHVESEKDLIEIAQKNEKGLGQNALWLLAVIKLASLAGDVHQHQVKTSAIQIFLRIFNTHGSKLSTEAWDVSHRLAFPKLLKSARDCDGQESENLEVYSLVVDGISKIDLLFLPSFHELHSFKLFWEQWIVFLLESTEISPFISISVYRNLKLVLNNVKADYMKEFSIYEFWIKQSTLPSYSQKFPKPTADALRELVSMYPLVHKSPERDRNAVLKQLTECALFPYYTISMPGTSHEMSNLQQLCTETLESLEIDNILLSDYILLLDSMIMSQYTETAEANRANFFGLSLWAQSALLDIIPSTKADISIEKVSPTVITTMNTVIKSGTSVRMATSIIMKLVNLENLTLPIHENSSNGNEIMGTVRIVLEVSDRIEEIPEIINFLSELIEAVKSRPLDAGSWDGILDTLREYSVLYERSINNLNYYEVMNPALAEALEFGTTEQPKILHKREISFFCLDLLCSLGSEKNLPFSNKSLKYFKSRVMAVLHQYVGDSKILGCEPLREVLRHELACVLELLLRCPDNSEIVDVDMRKTLLKAMAGGVHPEYQRTLQNILESAISPKI